jgi:hypothetical protein
MFWVTEGLMALKVVFWWNFWWGIGGGLERLED